MCRLFALLSGVGLVSVLAGCHTTGICDCDMPGHKCCYPCGWHHTMPAVYAGRVAEQIKEAPKPEGKEEGEAAIDQ